MNPFSSRAGSLLILADVSAASAPLVPPPAGLSPFDWGIVALYAFGALFIGWWMSRDSDSSQDYFVGNRRMNPIIIGISLFVSLLSTISYLSMPGEVLGKGPVYLSRIFAYPLTYLIVGLIILPVYMRQHVTSAYQLLENRLGLSVRLLGAVLFVLMRLIWMALLVYLTGKAMCVMTGLDPSWITVIVVITGMITVIYTSMGGAKAVVIMDVCQTVLLFSGALLVLGVVTYRLGGLNWFPTTWQPHWDNQPLFTLDPSTRVSGVGTILSTMLFLVCTSGGDQTSVQRFMSTVDTRAAKRSLAVQLTGSTIVGLTLGLVGFALMRYFQVFQDRLPSHLNLTAHADDLFPWFIAYELPVGISGIVVAGMFGAAMSSLDSGINSITAVVMTDFLDRFGLRPKTERAHLLAAKFLALTIGIVVTLGSTQMDKIPGNITAVTSKTANLLSPTVFCLFVFAMFVPFANAAGVWAGALAGTTAAILAAFSGPIFGVDPVTGADPISFQWITLISLAVNLTVGAVVSLAVSPAFRTLSKNDAVSPTRRRGKEVISES